MKCKLCFEEVPDLSVICPTCARLVESASQPFPEPEQLHAQVLEVVVRQATSNPDWRGLCDLAMQVNRITESEVQAEVERRGGTMHPPKARAPIPTSTKPGLAHKETSLSGATDRLAKIRDNLRSLSTDTSADAASLRSELARISTDFESALEDLQSELLRYEFASGLPSVERELVRTTRQPITPPSPANDPHRIDW